MRPRFIIPELNSLKNVKHTSEVVSVPKKGRQRRLHKALLRYHDPAGWPLIREGLTAMGREDLIGNSPHQLVPPEGRNERGPKWMKDANQGQKPLLASRVINLMTARAMAT